MIEGPVDPAAGPLFAASDEFTARIARLAIRQRTTSDPEYLDVQSIIDWQANVTSENLQTESTEAFIRVLASSLPVLNRSEQHSVSSDVKPSMSESISELTEAERLLLL